MLLGFSERFINEDNKFNKIMLKEIKNKMQWKFEEGEISSSSTTTATTMKTYFHL